MFRAYRVRLQLAGVVTIFTQQNEITGKELSALIHQQHRLPDKLERFLVRPATSTSPPAIIDPNSSLGLDYPDDILEFWKSPSMIRVELAASVTQLGTGSREMALDLSTPLAHIIPMFMKAFNIKENDPFVFKYINAPGSSSSDYGMKSLNTNFALTQQKGLSKSEIGTLVLFPSQYFMKVPYIQAADCCEIEGLMRKRSRNEKGTSKKRRIFVLKDNVMLYYTSKEDKQPCGFILLEYFTARLEVENGKQGTQPISSIILEKSNQDFQFKNNEYVLVPSEEGPTAQDWFNHIQERCFPGGDTRVFGVNLKPLYNKYTGEVDSNPIPVVIRKAVNWLRIHGMEVEGIFRLSGTLSEIEFYREEFDKGKDVVFSPDLDHHTVAGLLKLFLRNLPEPLIPYDLYESFLAPFDNSQEKSVIVSQIGELIKKLPSQNQLVLKFLFSFLGKVSQMSNLNKMTTNNLSIVFGPNILKQNPKYYNPIKAISDNAKMNDLTSIFIDDNETLFQEIGAEGWEQKPASTLRPRALVDSTTSFTNKSPYAYMPADKILKEGVLLRKGKNKWTESFTQLTRSNLIFSKPGKQSKEIIELNGFAVGNSQERPHCFVLTKGGWSEYFSGVDSTDLKAWTTAINWVTIDLASSSDPYLDPSNPLRKMSYGSGPLNEHQEIIQLKRILAEETRMREGLQKQVESLKSQIDQADSWKISVLGKMEILERMLLKVDQSATVVSKESHLASSTNNEISVAVAMYDFSPSSEKEIALKTGDQISLEIKGVNGWWKGTNNRTDQSGYFPSAYVSCDK